MQDKNGSQQTHSAAHLMRQLSKAEVSFSCSTGLLFFQLRDGSALGVAAQCCCDGLTADVIALGAQDYTGSPAEHVDRIVGRVT